MQKIESKTGTISQSQDKIFNYLSDFRHFEHLIPQDKISDWYAESEKCSFKVPTIGDAQMEIVEKEPYKLIKIAGEGRGGSAEFLFWIQLKEVDTQVTKIKLTAKPELNKMLEAVAKHPIQKFMNMLVDQLEKFSFEA